MQYKQLRNLMFPLHRYIGLVVGLILAVVGLTGSLLVFYPEMNEFLVHQQIGEIVPQGEPLSLEVILDKAKTAYANQPDIKIDRISPSAYHHQYSEAIYAATFSPKPAEPVSNPIPGKSPVGLIEVLQKADAALPEGEIISAVLPTAPDGVFEIRKKLPQDANYWGEHRVYLDQYSGKVLRVDATQTNSLGTKITNSFARVHYGTFWGLPSRILYLFVGLSPTILMITGFVMWQYRYRGKARLKDTRLRERIEQKL